MKRLSVLLLIVIGLAAVPARVMACGAHMYFNPDDFGVVGGAVVRMAGLAPPAPVFDLNYPPMASAVIGETNEITVDFSRPLFSENVRLELKGTRNVLLSEDVIALDERSGTVNISYQMLGSGYDSIRLTIIGEHKGKTVREVGQIYVRAKRPKAPAEEQVSQR